MSCSFNIFVFALCVQFFGFKNPFVQRLLREMMANVSGTAEQNLLSSTFCKGAPKVDHNSYRPAQCKDQDLLPYLASSHVTGKRSRRREITSTKSSSKANLKRSRPQDPTYVAETLDPEGEIHGIRDNGNPLTSLNEEFANSKQPPVSPPYMNTIPVQEEKSHISENDLPSNSADISNRIRSIVPAEETIILIGSRNCTSNNLTGTFPDNEKPVSMLHLSFPPLLI